jgi:hypothetical protein
VKKPKNHVYSAHKTSQYLMLTSLQLELLKTFSRPIPEKQVLEIKQLLADYFAKKVDDDVDTLFAEKVWDETTIDGWLNNHDRTPYHHE